MIAILLNALFFLGALVAITAIGTTLRCYAPQAFALRGALRANCDQQDLRFNVTELAVSVRTNVLRPDFTIQKAELRPRAVLLAAA